MIDKTLFKSNSKQYTTPYGNVLIHYAARSIGVRVSGGFDSAIMLYLIAKTVYETNSGAQIYPFTVRRVNTTDEHSYNRVNSYIYADAVIEYVKKQFPNVVIHPAIKEDANYWWVADHINGRNISSYTTAQQNLSRYNKWRLARQRIINEVQPDITDIMYIDYGGTTKNPTVGIIPQSEESHRDTSSSNTICKDSVTTAIGDVTNGHVIYTEPFRNADKRITLWLADTHLILQDVLDMTKSCEGGPYETVEFSKECGKCWWCLEREWALENYKND